MYAVFSTGGKQYKAQVGDVIDIERVEGEAGAKIDFSEIMAVGEDGGSIQVGAPTIESATVQAEIVEQLRGVKLIAFKMKKRKGYRRKKGHRQELTRIKISEIKA